MSSFQLGVPKQSLRVLPFSHLGGLAMSTADQARALMLRHHHLVKQRQQSMLSRANAEIGMPGEAGHWSHIQGKPSADASRSYDRSGSALS